MHEPTVGLEDDQDHAANDLAQRRARFARDCPFSAPIAIDQAARDERLFCPSYMTFEAIHVHAAASGNGGLTCNVFDAESLRETIVCRKCPKYKKEKLRLLKGPTGPFWGCAGYRDGCKATFPDLDGKPKVTTRQKAS